MDDGEPRLAGWSFLVEGPGAGGVGINSVIVVTGADGSFLVVPEPIPPIPPGEEPWCWDYTVTEILQGGWGNTDPGGSTLSKVLRLKKWEKVG